MFGFRSAPARRRRPTSRFAPALEGLQDRIAPTTCGGLIVAVDLPVGDPTDFYPIDLPGTGDQVQIAETDPMLLPDITI